MKAGKVVIAAAMALWAACCGIEIQEYTHTHTLLFAARKTQAAPSSSDSSQTSYGTSVYTVMFNVEHFYLIALKLTHA